MPDLGEARGKIILDADMSGVDGAVTKLDTFGKKTGEIGKTQRDVQPLLQKTGTTALVAGGAIAAGFAVAVKSASDFEFGMSAIQAVSGATADEMDLIREAALRIGKDTAFSAGDASLAMEELLKAGVSVKDTLHGAADATVALAAAGEIELPAAAGIAAAALNQFKMTADDLVGVTDIMAGAANASATGVLEIGQALSFVGPTAHAAGVGFKDAATMIALFSNNGIDGMRAGTALRSIISNLASPTKQAAGAMSELGLMTKDGSNVFFDAQGNMKSMEEVVGLLRGAYEGLTAEQQLAYGETMFGREQLSALSAIVGTTDEDFKGLVSSIDKVSAADVAATRLKNMHGSMEQLSGSAETLMITVGTQLIPRIDALVQRVTAAVNWFTELDGAQQKMIVTILGVVSGALLFLGVTAKIANSVMSVRSAILLATGAQKLFGSATTSTTGKQQVSLASMIAHRIAVIATTTATGIATAAQWAFNAAISANPIGIIVVAILALVAALVWFFTQTELGQDIWNGFVDVLKTAWEAIVTAVQTAVGFIITFVQQHWGLLLSLLIGPLGLVIQWIVEHWSQIVAFFQTVVNTIVGFFVGLWQGMVAIWTGIMQAIQPFVDWFAEHVVPLIEAAVGLVAAIFNFLWQTVVWIFGLIVAAVQWAVDLVANTILTVWGAILGFVTPIFKAVWDFIVSIFKAIWDFIAFIVKTTVDSIVRVWSGIIGFITPIFNAIWGFISGIFNRIFSFVAGIVKNTVDSIVRVWGGIIGFVSDIFGNVYNAIKDPLQDALDFIMGIKDKIFGFFGDAGKWLLDAGKNIIDGLVKGIEGALGWLTDTLKGITNLIPKTKGPESVDKKLLEPAGEMIMQGLISGIQSEVGNLMGMLGGLNVSIPAELDGALAASVNMGEGRGNTDSRVFNYNAAPGSAQISSEQELFGAIRRSKVVVPGW